MAPLAHHVLLVLAVWALLGTALRAASLHVPSGIERALAIAAFAAALAVIEVLVAGLTGLGTGAAALTALAAATWTASRLLPAPRVTPAREAAEWWSAAAPLTRLGAGAALGVAGSWIAGNAYRPDVGIDGAYYHLPEIVTWIKQGTPGSVELIHPWLEVGNYPVTQELLLTWGMGISRSLISMAIVGVLMLAMLAGSTWVALRELGSPPRIRLVAVLALVSVPVLVAQVDGPANDVPALSWLASTTALALAARTRPNLLVPMLVAAGLAVGTKTTVLPLAAVAVAWALLVNRGPVLRSIRVPLLVAAAVAAAVGLIWYLRNLISHGSPFYPFATAPWGDDAPVLFETYTSFIRDPAAALESNVGAYTAALSGGWLIIFAALIAPIWSHTRAAVAGAALVAGSLILWASAPTTGVSEFAVFSASVSQTRYLLPVVGLSILVVVYAGRSSRHAQTPLVVLAAGSVWSFGQLATGDFPGFGAVALVCGGAAAGVLVAAVVTAAEPRSTFRLGRTARTGLALGGATILALALTVAASGYSARYAIASSYFDKGLVAYFASEVGSGDSRPLNMTPEVAGMLTGDEIKRDVRLIPLDASCEDVEGLRRSGWVILRDDALYRRTLGFESGACLGSRTPTTRIGAYRVFAPAGF